MGVHRAVHLLGKGPLHADELPARKSQFPADLQRFSRREYAGINSGKIADLLRKHRKLFAARGKKYISRETFGQKRRRPRIIHPVQMLIRDTALGGSAHEPHAGKAERPAHLFHGL